MQETSEGRSDFGTPGAANNCQLNKCATVAQAEGGEGSRDVFQLQMKATGADAAKEGRDRPD